MRRVVFLGAGAIGAGIGGLLWDSGVDVLLVARGAHGEALATHGLDLRLPGGPRHLRVPVGRVEDVRPTDLVVLATMGHDTAAAVATLPPDQPVVTFQNGLAPFDDPGVDAASKWDGAAALVDEFLATCRGASGP